MGHGNMDLIPIQMKNDVTPITQGKHTIPIHFKKLFKKKIKYMRDIGLIEGRCQWANVWAGYITW